MSPDQSDREWDSLLLVSTQFVVLSCDPLFSLSPCFCICVGFKQKEKRRFTSGIVSEQIFEFLRNSPRTKKELDCVVSLYDKYSNRDPCRKELIFELSKRNNMTTSAYYLVTYRAQQY